MSGTAMGERMSHARRVIVLSGKILPQQKLALLTIVILSAFYFTPGFAGTFDGVYKGTMDLNTAVENHPACSKSWVSVLEVKDSHMSLTTNIKPVNLYTIDVGADGAFNGKASAQGDSEWRTFTGTIAGSNVTGRFYNRTCNYFLNFQRAQ
jgi:hypothetical protein